MHDTLLVATKKGLFTASRSRQGRWSITGKDFLGDHLSYAWADPRSGHRFACLEHGHFGVKLHRSTDAGASWKELPAPAFPPKPEGLVDMNPVSKKETPWAVKRAWAMAAGLPDQPGLLWLGTIPGGLFRSEDGGESWALVRPLWDHPQRREWFGGGADLPGIHSICVDPRDGRHVLLGVSCGGCWETRDGGASWALRASGMRAAYMPPEQAHLENVQDPHCVVRCAGAPDALWAQHHNGIFRSVDDGAHWTEIERAGPSTFGFAVAVHPREPGTAWFLPAIKDEKRIPVDGRLVVTRTRDGGKSFDVLSRGLPQVDAYDLVYRHALDIDGSGERLAFGSTTGALYVSENGGDAWSCLSEHLPPIDGVRFA